MPDVEKPNQAPFVKGVFLGVVITINLILAVISLLGAGRNAVWEQAVDAGVAVKISANHYEFKKCAECGGD